MTTQADKTTSAAAMKRAYLTMERMQGRIDDLEGARSEPIAIIGMACRLPGGVVDTETYWDLLSSGRDGIREVPADRWDVEAFYDKEPHQPGKMSTRWGGFLDHIDRFDHEFFGISRREAVSMDPQQRLILEVTWEALEVARNLAGSATGVFMGICSSDYATEAFANPLEMAAHTSTGSAHSMATGRVSYLLDLRGPSVSVDAACSSSLVAVHQACQSLRLRETDLAISGAVNVVLSPQVSISFSQFPEMLAADGRCKTFDASADGFVRSEGCGAVVLKRLSDAVRDGDQVVAVIRGTALNQDGRSSGLTAPNGAAQRAVFRSALAASGVEPHQLGYIETHGAGTKLGDPIEVDALAEVYGRQEGPPLFLGAVKTNIGHLEAASGIAGLIKAALCVERGLIPPNLHFSDLNPHTSFDGTTLAMPKELTPWPAVQGRRFAGLSSFGFSGTNAHLILEEAPDRPASAPDLSRPRSVLALSAKTETALLKLARRYQDRLMTAGPGAVADVCFSANAGRSHFPYRCAVTGESAQDLAARLGDYVRGDPGDGLAQGRAAGTAASDVVFLFTGQGPQRAGMARELYDTQPTFRRVLDRCDEILRPVLKTPLLSALYPQDPESDLINDMSYAQPGLFAVEYALAELWRSWGVEPVAVLGHSLGEYAAACFAGVMSLEDGLRLVAERGRLLQDLAEAGSMAAIFASRADVVEELARHDPAQISIAAVNGPANTTVSGVREIVTAVTETFASRGVEVKALRISTSSHSPLVEPVLEPLRRVLEKVTFSPPRIPLVSNLTGQLWQWDKAPDIDYWCDHARQPVLFADGVEALHEMGYRTFLEVGPAPTLLGLAGEILPAGGEVMLLPSLRPKMGDWEVLLSTVSQLYVHGADIDWAGFDQDYTRSRVRLPRYPYDSVRCWHDLGGDPRFLSQGASSPRADAGANREGANRDDRGRDGGGRADPGRSLQPPAGGPKGLGRTSLLPSARELLGMPAGDRVEALIPALIHSVQGALGSKSSTVDPDRELLGFGLDSLMAVELRNEIQRRLTVSIAVASFLSGATIRSVAGQIVAQVEGGRNGDADPTGGADPSSPIRRVQRVEDPAELLRRIEEAPDGPAAPLTKADRRA
jgi:acyl transferase domain-containing protein/acyl carrier protein